MTYPPRPKPRVVHDWYLAYFRSFGGKNACFAADYALFPSSGAKNVCFAAVNAQGGSKGAGPCAL